MSSGPEESKLHRAFKALCKAAAAALGVTENQIAGDHASGYGGADLTRGYNRGFDDGEMGLAYRGNELSPPNEPWKSAYLRGYTDGFGDGRAEYSRSVASGA